MVQSKKSVPFRQPSPVRQVTGVASATDPRETANAASARTTISPLRIIVPPLGTSPCRFLSPIGRPFAPRKQAANALEEPSVSWGAAPSQIAEGDEPGREQEERAGHGRGNWRNSARDDIELIDGEVFAI